MDTEVAKCAYLASAMRGLSLHIPVEVLSTISDITLEISIALSVEEEITSEEIGRMIRFG